MVPASNLLPTLSYPIIQFEWVWAQAAAASQRFSSSLLYPGETEGGREEERERQREDQGQLDSSLSDEGSVCANEEESVCACVRDDKSGRVRGRDEGGLDCVCERDREEIQAGGGKGA
ncbi:Hypothetical predicted protein [Xyrichtys novacula]|uniref:Uncharacterized protein n=1 Tax=Xyrichtys novacula TaxID=13765 RepID=A0AAV1HL10_XYRNO|nr:Hypothetical predicted protein [Xyrichtys novacula]